jgi:hypothetical protein
MQVLQLAGATALLREVPRFTPGQWQRLFWDAGLKGSQVHLFVRDDAHPGSPWAMVLDTGDGLVDLEAFDRPVPSAQLEQAWGSEELFNEARGHLARIEVFAVAGRCPRQRACEVVARAAAAALRTTAGIAWLHPASGILLPAEPISRQIREAPPGRFPVDLYAKVRRWARPPLVLVDTVGLATFDQPDLEMEVDAAEADEAAAFLQQLAGDASLGLLRLDEQTPPIPGPLGVSWRGRLARATRSPLRAVMRLELGG